MARTASNILVEAESLLCAGEYRKAADALSQIDCAGLESATSARFHLLMGEALVLLGDSNHDHVDRAIDFYRSTSEHMQFAHAKYIKGLQLQSQGQLSEARESMIEAYAGFLRVQDMGRAARTQNRLAYIAHEQGNLDQAIEGLQLCIQRFSDEGDVARRGMVRSNLAVTFWRCGRLADSLAMYRAVEEEDVLRPQARVSMLLGRCGVIALLGDSKAAIAKIVMLTTETIGFPREHVIAYEYSGWIHLLAGKYKQAEIALSKGLKLALQSAPESPLISQIKRLYGDLYVATGKYDLAETYAREGLAVAEKLTERLEIAACYRVFAQVEQVRGNSDKARDWYAQAIGLFGRIGARYELATTRLLAGASDLYRNGERMAMLYLAKEYFESEKLTHLIAQVDRHLARSAPAVIAPRTTDKGAPTIVTVNPAMRKLLEFASHVAPCGMTVLLTGETGTGKDLVARHIHYASGRSGQFVPVNAAAIPGTMIEAELFGHAKGAYTGAVGDRSGLFEQADGGTFYLNEIADASAEFQAKLLDVLENRTVRRLGDNRTRTVDFRLIAATNHDIQARIKDNSFRLDLFHRLNEIPIHLPPLSARLEDIAPLIAHFLNELGAAGLSAEQADVVLLTAALSGREWPGNVRQLRATVHHLHALCGGDLTRMIDMALAEQVQSDLERFQQVLMSTGWNRSRTAEILGVSEGTVRNKIKRYCLECLEVAAEQ
jgi:DNA-binding NtrC family response regulator/tetratricopeptide (TPR) repeat protein